MRRTLIFFSILSVLLTAGVPKAHAQRTSEGSSAVTLSFTGAVVAPGLGLSADYTGYLLFGYWRAGINNTYRAFRAIDDVTGESRGNVWWSDLTVGGDFMYRLYSGRARVFNVYAGGGVFLGIETIDPFGKAPEGISTGYGAKNTFIYGVSVGVEGEWFFLSRLVPNLALSFGVRTPVKIASQIGEHFNLEAYTGLRYNF